MCIEETTLQGSLPSSLPAEVSAYHEPGYLFKITLTQQSDSYEVGVGSLVTWSTDIEGCGAHYIRLVNDQTTPQIYMNNPATANSETGLFAEKLLIKRSQVMRSAIKLEGTTYKYTANHTV
jgi:hypothetical protein